MACITHPSHIWLPNKATAVLYVFHNSLFLRQYIKLRWSATGCLFKYFALWWTFFFFCPLGQKVDGTLDSYWSSRVPPLPTKKISATAVWDIVWFNSLKNFKSPEIIFFSVRSFSSSPTVFVMLYSILFLDLNSLCWDMMALFQ